MADQPGQSKDALLGHRFAVELGGVIEAAFTECSGLQAQIEVFEYKEGGQNGYTHKLPGRTTFGNVTLKWGSTDSGALYDWLGRVASGMGVTSGKKGVKGERKDISILQFDSKGKQVRRWDLSGAYPVKWVGPSFNSTSSALAIETLEIAFVEMKSKAG